MKDLLNGSPKDPLKDFPNGSLQGFLKDPLEDSLKDLRPVAQRQCFPGTLFFSLGLLFVSVLGPVG